jgi:predicted dinucleotide-binding enzyme
MQRGEKTERLEEKSMKVAIIGKGNVGKAIASGLRSKHEIRFGHRDLIEPVREAAQWGEIIILAVPYDAAQDVVKELGFAADGKTVIDVSNALTDNMELAVGFTASAAEELQRMLPKSYVVKAFNTVFAGNQNTGRIGNEKLTLFVAGDDEEAKQDVMRLGTDIGFDAVDAGPLKNARYLEPMGLLMMNLGLLLRMGTKIGYKLVRG